MGAGNSLEGRGVVGGRGDRSFDGARGGGAGWALGGDFNDNGPFGGRFASCEGKEGGQEGCGGDY